MGQLAHEVMARVMAPSSLSPCRFFTSGQLLTPWDRSFWHFPTLFKRAYPDGMRFIASGYLIGVIYGFGYALLRFQWGADFNLLERIAITVFGSLIVAGGIGAAAGFLVVFCMILRRQYDQGRSQVL
jgi:hypothetical protein